MKLLEVCPDQIILLKHQPLAGLETKGPLWRVVHTCVLGNLLTNKVDVAIEILFIFL